MALIDIRKACLDILKIANFLSFSIIDFYV